MLLVSISVVCTALAFVIPQLRQVAANRAEVTAEERERLWEHMLKTWPNYAKYAERADRVIPVFEFSPVAV